jgi:preprotein translocase subunit SecF
MEFFKKTPSIPFMANRRWFYLISAMLMIGSLTLVATRGLNFGIDFTGGVVLELSYPEAVNIEAVRGTVTQAGFPDATVTQFGTDREVLIRTMLRDDQDAAGVGAAILDALRANNPVVDLRRTEVVGPQVGEELSENGGLAMLFAFIMISIYVGFRFEKKMAAGTVLAAIHDPIVILGFFAITQHTFDLATLAAILAVIGYSINDTVVVFDRVREVFHLKRKDTPQVVIDTAINQTLSRTLMTSFSTLFVVIALYVFGGDTLEGFSIAIIVGVIVGTYSSIFVAGALALDMKLNVRDIFPPQEEKDEVDALP